MQIRRENLDMSVRGEELKGLISALIIVAVDGRMDGWTDEFAFAFCFLLT